MMALFTVLALAATPVAPSAPQPATLALIVASNRGARPGRAPLLYADDDGAKYHHVFAAIAGEERTVLLTEFDRDTARLFPELQGRTGLPTRAAVIAAGEALAKRATRLRESGQAVRFYFVFAGHGDVEDGKGFIELSDGPFTADDLLGLLQGVGASEAHVILDSCNSFYVVNPRKPGGRRMATPRDAAEQLARRLPDVGVFLSTSAQAEVYEWSELQSGVFSHAVRSGLLGAADANGDGRVTYEELAGFVETAAADIKNPLYRPRVFARGPNGDAARTILERPSAVRVVLEVDEPGPVRLAVRDEEGLRWVDTYKESGAQLRLWVPAARAGALEVERLVPGASGAMERTAAYRIQAGAPGSAAPVVLATLDPYPPQLIERGAAEIFRSLFRRPYGPQALAEFLSGGGMERVAELPPEPVERESGLALAGRPLRLAFRGGMALPRVRASGGSVEDPSFSPGADLAAGVALPLTGSVAAQVEVGWLEASSSRPWRSSEFWAAVLGPGYLGGREPPATDVSLQVLPLLVGLELERRTWWNITASLSAGAGAAFQRLQVVPRETFTAAVQRAQAWSPAAQAGVGLAAALPGGFSAGIDVRAFGLLSPLRAFSLDFTVAAVRLSAVLAWGPAARLPR